MNTYPNLNNEPDLLKLETRDDEIKNLNYQTERHHHGNIIKSLEIDVEYYKKKYESLNKNEVFMIISEILIGALGLGVGSGLTI